jgi:hypothetical protein
MLAPIALAALLAVPLAGLATRAEAASKRSAKSASTETPAPKKSASYRQFTGTVVALDASSITVEKGGKTPKQMVFARHAAMRSTGDVGKDARVTVYWRDEAGRRSRTHRAVGDERNGLTSNTAESAR